MQLNGTSYNVITSKWNHTGLELIVMQGQWKLFITGQAKLNPEDRTVQLNAWAVDNFTTADILYTSIISLIITLPFCILLSFLHNRIPCMHNAWAADNLKPLDMLFLSIIAQYSSLISPNITLELFFSSYYLEKWNFIFTLRKTGPAKTGAAGPFPPAL